MLTNEFVGRLILLGINISCIITLSLIGIMSLKMNYKWRKPENGSYQDNFYYSAIVILIYIFTSIPNLFDKYIIAPLFKESLKNGLPISYFIIVSIILASTTHVLYRRIVCNRYYIQLKYSLLLVTISVIYWYSRFDGNYEYFPILKNEKWADIKILDLPFLIYSYFTIVLLFHSLFQKKGKHIYKEFIMPNLPLESIEEDQYKRTVVYRALIDIIKNTATNHKKSLSIGIANRWGEGKTSFLKLVKKEIEEDLNTIIVEFNPWYSSNSNNLTLDFFQTLDNKISQYYDTPYLLDNFLLN